MTGTWNISQIVVTEIDSICDIGSCHTLQCFGRRVGNQIKSNQKHICKAPYVAGESKAHSGRD